MAKRPPVPAAQSARIPEHTAYFRNKENRPSYAWNDVAPEEHSFVFTVAKATSAEVLGTIRGEVDNAIANAETLEQFKERLGPKLQKLGWWGKKEQVDPVTGEIKTVQLGSPARLRTIYWANTRTAYAAGAWERAQRTKKTMPFLEMLLGPSEVHRPLHEQVAGTIRLVDDPWWLKWFPPNGWGCNCWTRQLSKAQARKAGYDPSKPAPDFGNTSYTNPRTGETMSIPRGIDPGWESNPGATRQAMLARHVAGKLDGAPEEISRVVARDVITSQKFQQIQAREVKGVAPVGVMPKALQGTLGSSSRTVMFSDDTSKKQAGERRPGDAGRPSRGHPDIKAQDYLHVQELLDSGEAHRDSANHVTVAKRIEGAWWTATVKATADGKEVYLQSFHRTTEADARRRQKKAREAEG